jgi:hypothetical protein
MNSTPMRARHAVLATLATILLVTSSVATHAQTPPPAPPSAPPKMDCGAKPEHPGRLASDTQRRVWQREATAYLECYKKYVLSLQQVAEDATKTANTAIDDYNATIKQFEQAAKGE